MYSNAVLAAVDANIDVVSREVVRAFLEGTDGVVDSQAIARFVEGEYRLALINCCFRAI